MRLTLAFLALLATACGGTAARTAPRHEGPDVVTAEWTSGDDAVLEGAPPATPP